MKHETAWHAAQKPENKIPFFLKTYQLWKTSWRVKQICVKQICPSKKKKKKKKGIINVNMFFSGK